MTLKYRVLELIPEEARRKVAERRVFDRVVHGQFYQCADGMCVWGALLVEAGNPVMETYDDEACLMPAAHAVANQLGLEAYTANLNPTKRFREISAIVELNDSGKLDTPEAVKKLLLGEE